jgi:hypothetical protein
MDMTYLGADVDGLDEVAGRFGAAAEVTDAIKSRLTQMADQLQYYGLRGDLVRGFLRGEANQWLTQTSESLQEFGVYAHQSAEAQRQVSDGSVVVTVASTMDGG